MLANHVFIDEGERRIYLDNSTRSNFQTCKELGRLANVLGYRTLEKVTESPLDFGHAVHHGIATYYDWQAGGYFDEKFKWHTYPDGAKPSGVRIAQAAFLRDISDQSSKMPIQIEAAQTRSVERGYMLIEAYIERWKNEPYENILRPDGSPLTEIYFEIFIAKYGEWDIYYCGTIDRIMMHIMTRRPRIFETKTTTQGLSQFLLQCKPNQQIDGYFKIAWPLMAEQFPDLPIITDAVWDCIFVSKRAPDTSKSLKQRFWMWGIDVTNDFARQETARSARDITEFMIDLEDDALQFAKWLMSDTERWPRAKHGRTCHLFGGCAFRMVCTMNEGNQSILDTFFERKPWNPRKTLRQV